MFDDVNAWIGETTLELDSSMGRHVEMACLQEKMCGSCRRTSSKTCI